MDAPVMVRVLVPTVRRDLTRHSCAATTHRAWLSYRHDEDIIKPMELGLSVAGSQRVRGG